MEIGKAWAVTTVLAFFTGPVVMSQEVRPSNTIACYVGYPDKDCREHQFALRTMLLRHKQHLPQQWTWVLVRSTQWNAVLENWTYADKDSPAFTLLDARYTVLEEALFTTVPGRSAVLLKKWQRPLDTMLEYAVTHELGHILCRNTIEAEAERNAESLRKRVPIPCSRPRTKGTEIHLAAGHECTRCITKP